METTTKPKHPAPGDRTRLIVETLRESVFQRTGYRIPLDEIAHQKGDTAAQKGETPLKWTSVKARVRVPNFQMGICGNFMKSLELEVRVSETEQGAGMDIQWSWEHQNGARNGTSESWRALKWKFARVVHYQEPEWILVPEEK